MPKAKWRSTQSSIADAKFHSTGLLAYVRSFDFAGQSAKFDVIVPTSSFAAHGFVDGRRESGRCRAWVTLDFVSR
jgi:hypothetical protein